MTSPGGSGASAGRLRSAPLAVQRRDRMPAERTTMRQVREVLRLKFVGGVPIREIARRIGVAASTVRVTLKRFQTAGLSWPLPEELTDAALEAKLFADAGTKQGHRRQVAAGAQALADRALCVRRVARAPGRHRLPRRCRRGTSTAFPTASRAARWRCGS